MCVCVCVCLCARGLTKWCYNGRGQTEGHYKIEYDQIPGVAEPIEEVKLCRLCVCVCGGGGGGGGVSG